MPAKVETCLASLKTWQCGWAAMSQRSCVCPRLFLVDRRRVFDGIASGSFGDPPLRGVAAYLCCRFHPAVLAFFRLFLPLEEEVKEVSAGKSGRIALVRLVESHLTLVLALMKVSATGGRLPNRGVVFPANICPSIRVPSCILATL